MMFFSIKKYFIRIACLTIMFSLWSCSEGDSEDIPSGAAKAKMQIMLQLPGENEATRGTEAGSAAENKINSVHLFVFDSSGNKEFDIYMTLPYGGSSSDVDMSLWDSERVIIVLNTNILSSLSAARNIHVVANMAQTKLASVTNEASLKAILTDAITAEIPQSNALVMHGMCQGHIFTSNIRAALSLVRNVAKVRLTVNTTNSGAGANSTLFAPADNIAVTAVDVANRSYLATGVNHNPAGTAYISYTEKSVSLSSSGTGTKSFALSGFYINENIGNPENGTGPALIYTPTYLLIRIPYNNGSETITDNYYKIKINADNGCLINRNTIYDMAVNIDALGGETPQTAPEISATLNVLPWNEKTLISDLTQTYISVESTTLNVAGGELNFQYATNAEVSKRSASSSASWLTATLDPLNDNNLKITASSTGYTTPRTATVSIKVNDLTKVITVNQAAEPALDGSITLTPSPIYLSSAHPSRTVTLEVTGSAPWTNFINNPAIATYSPASGTGNATLTFTRGATANNADFRFMNMNTLTYADVKVCNLDLKSSVTELQIPADGITNETEVGIVASGGAAIWAVKSKPVWMIISNVNGDMLYSATAEPDEADRAGTIVLYHVDDSDLTVTINVTQSAKYIVFEEFDHMIMTYDWSESTGVDLDTATEFADKTDSPLSSVFPHLASKPVGWGSLGSGTGVVSSPAFTFTNKVRVADATSTAYNRDSNLILRWGGDNRAKAGTENIVFYMSNFRTAANLASLRAKGIRYVYLDLYATWYETADPNTKIKITVRTYKNGTPTRSSQSSATNTAYGTFTYLNASGGTIQPMVTYTESKSLSTKGSPGTYTTTYVKMAIIRYDIEKNDVMLNSVATSRSVSSLNDVIDPDYPQALPGESKDDYAARVDEYCKNRK